MDVWDKNKHPESQDTIIIDDDNLEIDEVDNYKEIKTDEIDSQIPEDEEYPKLKRCKDAESLI